MLVRLTGLPRRVETRPLTQRARRSPSRRQAPRVRSEAGGPVRWQPPMAGPERGRTRERRRGVRVRHASRRSRPSRVARPGVRGRAGTGQLAHSARTARTRVTVVDRLVARAGLERRPSAWAASGVWSGAGHRCTTARGLGPRSRSPGGCSAVRQASGRLRLQGAGAAFGPTGDGGPAARRAPGQPVDCCRLEWAEQRSAGTRRLRAHIVWQHATATAGSRRAGKTGRTGRRGWRVGGGAALRPSP